MASLTIIRGLPGSAKSTTARQLCNALEAAGAHAAWFEADQFFIDAAGDYKWEGSKIGQAHEWCRHMVYDALQNDFDVIVSNTFTLKSEMRPYFDMIQSMGRNPNVICMQANFGSVHDVPAATLLNMQKRFQYDISDMFKEF